MALYLKFSLTLISLFEVFGNGLGEVVHMAERECSIQRRHQKIIEETPSPFLEKHPGKNPHPLQYLFPNSLTFLVDLRKKMCDAALSLCRTIKYGSAGNIFRAIYSILK